MSTPTTSPDSEHLAEELRTVARRFCTLAEELGSVAVDLADLEARQRAAHHAAGLPADPQPPARELAADVLHSAVGALRPFVPLVVAESAARAEKALTRRP